MSTPKTFARRLRKLADYLETKVAPAVAEGRVKWNMCLWAEKPPKPELNCGTAACAAGYATNIFHRQGLTLERGRGRFSGGLEITYRAPGKRAVRIGKACRAFFGTVEPFDPIYYDGTSLSIPVVVARLRESADELHKTKGATK